MVTDNALAAAYILHYTPFRDTSFIVDAFTLTSGRLGLVARGARNAKPRTRALYAPFRPLLLSWHGEGELRTLTGIEESGVPLPLEGAALACGYYVNELVLRLSGKEQSQPELFGHYAMALASLAAGGVPDMTLRVFELQLLELIGVLPDLSRCTPDGSLIEADRRYRYHPANAVAIECDSRLPGSVARGGVGADVHPDGLTPDQAVELDGQTLLDMAALDITSSHTREQAKVLNRRLVAEQLGGRPLRSRSMFEALVPPKTPTTIDTSDAPAIRPAEPADAQAMDIVNTSDKPAGDVAVPTGHRGSKP